ncbi:intein-containing DNA-directed RNA polymerase subunit RPB2 [Cedratvirus kamchatka]|uniref:DNA-directed RNA polymerase n=1 Tax=Cedratvirus kamchatka TaxID=2716914 RepID=A0A6G8MZB8_9VIRU|nr:intein-containing DNA-directed RNA polymerase subunit RPB2 [Cedratvirus kamchatka]
MDTIQDKIMNSPFVPPLKKVTETLDEFNSLLPGGIRISENGELLKSYITYSGFTGDIINNYNNFIIKELPEQLRARPLRLADGYLVYFLNPFADKPVIEASDGKVPLLPITARQRNLTYSSPFYAELVLVNNGKEVARHNKPVFIGKVPVMTGSILCHLYGLSDQEKMEIGECPQDPLGYFIIKGTEKIIFFQEKLRLNRYLIFNTKKRGVVCRFTSYTSKGTSLIDLVKGDNKSIRLALHFLGKEKTMPVFLAFRILLGYHGLLTEGSDVLQIITWFVLTFTPEKHRKKIQAVLQSSLIEVAGIANSYEYLRTLNPKEISDVELARALTDDLFPQTTDVTNKLFMLALMTSQYALYIAGLRGVDDRDSVSNKRFESAGVSLQQLFGSLWNKTITNAEASIEETTKSSKGAIRGDVLAMVSKFLKFNIMTEALVDTFTPGSWGIKGSYAKNNITDTLNRESVLSTYAQLTKINTPTRREAKQPHIRMVQMTQLGFIDAIETPEGRAVGLIKHKAIGAQSTPAEDDRLIIKQVLPLLNVTYSEQTPNGVLCNGKFIGWGLGEKVRQMVIDMRRKRTVPQFTSVVLHYDNVLYISTDSSRLARPLLIVDDEDPDFTIYEKKKLEGADFQTLLEEGAAEFVDAMEQEHLYIAQSLDDLRKRRARLESVLKKVEEARSLVNRLEASSQSPSSLREILPKKRIVDDMEIAINLSNMVDEDIFELYQNTVDQAKNELSLAENALERAIEQEKPFTHVEMDPNSLLSISASLVPLPDNNMGPRNMYTCSMMKQALGIYHSGHNLRFDSTIKMLATPTPPIFQTQTNEWLGMNELPAGDTVIVALTPYYGFNQEDAFVFNKASIERGLFSYIIYTSYGAVESKKGGDVVETFMKPKVDKPSAKRDVYHALGDNGVAEIGRAVEAGDVLISKSRRNTVTGKVDVENVRLGIGERGVVERVLIDRNEEGLKIIKVKIREVRLSSDPVIGDKFACNLPESEALTSDGWIRMDELTTDHEIATLSEGKLVYEKPSAVHCYDYDGPMYHMQSQLVEKTVTPNHRMWVKKRDAKNFGFIKAEDCFGKRLKYKKNAEWDAPDYQFSLPPLNDNSEKSLEMNSWLTLFGIWIAEGWATPERVTFAANKPRVREALTQACSILGFKVFTPKDHKWNISNKQLCAYLSTLSVGSTNKRLPSWCFSLSQSQSKTLLEGLMLGDGHKTKTGSYEYYTSSKGLADDVSILALHSGWSANIKKRFDKGHSVWLDRDQRYITSTADAYVVKIIRTKNEPQMNHGHVKTQQGQKEEYVQYTGKVYCCTVTSGVFYMRENGKTVWTGNSRYAQKGTIGLIVPPEDMPFTADGMVPDIVINPLCFTLDTTVSLFNGLSRKISSMKEEGGMKIWTWTKEGLMQGEQIEMAPKGKKKVVKLTLEDGRTIRCTPDHRFLVADGEEHKWVEAQNLELLSDSEAPSRLVMGLESVLDESDEDEKDWSIETSDFTFSMFDEEEREKSLAFARILGLVLSDGCLYEFMENNKLAYQSRVNLGHMLDVQALLHDIVLITGKSPKVMWDKVCWALNLPRPLARSLASLDNITKGRRSQQEDTLPSFLLSPDCPKSIVREFLAGLFGGDGHVPVFSDHKNRKKRGASFISGVAFSQTIPEKFLDSMKEKMSTIINLLIKVGVEGAVLDKPRRVQYSETSYKPKDYKTNPRVEVKLRLPARTSFCSKVGFRYCVQKQCRLTAANSYWRFQEKVKEQHDKVIKRALELIQNKDERVMRGSRAHSQTALDISRKEFLEHELPLNEHYSLSSLLDLNNRKAYSKRRGCDNISMKQFDYKFISDAHNYLSEIGCREWFEKGYVVKKEMECVPTFNLRVLDRREDGEEEVYDISVKETENFLANSAVVHNCIPSRMTIGKLMEIVASKVGALRGERVNATAFNNFDIKGFEEALPQYGYERRGTEKLFSGVTGKPLDADIFIGPCYYMMLRHLVKGKMQIRSSALYQAVSHQPVGGRSKGGALRIGNMEKNAMLSHGASDSLVDSFMYRSDAYEAIFCTSCGSIAIASDMYDNPICRQCEDKAKFGRASIPYASVWLKSLLTGAGINLRYKFEEKTTL